MLNKWICMALTASLIIGCSDQNKNHENTEVGNVSISSKVIYGNDSRRDWNEVIDQNLLRLADSTLGIMDKADVSFNGSSAQVTTHNLRLCPSEKFNTQKAGPWCSGFLVGPDLVVTAGHCVESNAHCSNLSFIFGFAKKSDNHNPSVVRANDVYGCKQVLGRRFTQIQTDWALIQLDRRVEDHEPLKVRRSGQVEVNTPLTLIGHPSGLPSKIARDGKVRGVQASYFQADLDSFGGNSGSAVFNTLTNEVEGILARGRTDYIFEKNCRSSNICENGIAGNCSTEREIIEAEHVIKISELVHLIPELPVDSDNSDDIEDDVDTEEYSSSLVLPIPDSSLRKTYSEIKDVPEIMNTSDLKIKIKLEHTYISDLSILLISPSNKAIYLHYKTGRRVVNINGVYGTDLTSAQDIGLLGPQPRGSWRLRIIDHTPYDSGRLLGWALELP